MTPIKRKLLYIFRGSLLRLRVTWNHGEALTLSVGYNVDRTDDKGKPKWDGFRCRQNTTHGKDKVPAATINKVLEQLENRIDKAFYEFECKDIMPSAADLKEVLSPSRKQNVKKLSSVIKEYLDQQSILNQWSDKSKKTFSQALDNLVDVFGDDTAIDDITDDDIVKLINYLTSKECYMHKHDGDEPVRKKGLNNNTINKYMTVIRSFSRWAVDKGYCSKTSLLKNVKYLKTAKLPVVYLTPEELSRFMSVEMSPSDREVADAFYFCCFTGLRYSDVSNLRWSQVKEDRIQLVTKKTADLIEIELNRFSRSVLDRKERLGDEEMVFKMVSNAEFNKIVKRIAKKAGIDDPVRTISYSGAERKTTTIPKWNYITSHTPRKTFVTNALSLGISPSIVMKWTGHKTYNAMKPYIDIISTAKQESMDKFNEIDLEKGQKPNN